MAALRDMRAIWHVTTVQRDARSVAVMRWAAAAFAALGIIIVTAAAARHRVAWMDAPVLVLRLLAGVGGAWLAMAWLVLFVPASVLLNSAANARLLPRQRRRLLQMAAAGALLTMAGLGLALGSWAALPPIALYLLGFTLTRAGHPYGVALIVFPGNWGLMAHLLPPAFVAWITGPTGLPLALALLALAFAWALLRLYPAGGDAHLDKRADRVKRINRVDGAKWTREPGHNGPVNWLTARAYAAELGRDCRMGYRGADPGRMLMHVLGPTAHWSAWIPAMAVLLALGVAVRALTVRYGGVVLDASLQGVIGGGLGTLVTIVAFSTAQYTQQVVKTGGEQALLRLTPLAGGTALLNRRLATQLLHRTIGNWAALTAVILVLTWLVGCDAVALLRQFALCCLAGQVALFGLLGDFARGGIWNPRTALRAGGVAVLEAGLAVALGLACGAAAWIWPWLIVIATGTAAVLLRRGWRRMLAAPPAFPAGRRA